MAEQDPVEFYRKNIDKYDQKAERQGKIYDRLAWLRAIIFLGGFATIFLLFSVSLAAGGLGILGMITVFVLFVKWHEGYSRRRKYFLQLRQLNEEEIQRMEGNFETKKDGSAYLDLQHPYLYDLDIFGHKSVFSFVDRTATFYGEQMLSRWLSSPARVGDIHLRQKAVAELAEKPGWRQQLRVTELNSDEEPGDMPAILEWLNEEEDVFIRNKGLQIFLFVWPVVVITLVIGSFFMIPGFVATMAVMVSIWIIWKYRHYVNSIHQHVSDKSKVLKKYQQLFQEIEQEKFESELLPHLQSGLLINHTSASAATKKLASYAEDLDLRYNIFAAIFLNLFLLWDLHVVLKLERWKRRVRMHGPRWFEAVAEIDALSSFAAVRFNNPEWTFPNVQKGPAFIRTTELGHFLIPKQKRITNDFEISGPGKIHLITGSNMAGKSTFLRTIGVNIVLAMAGAPVCARTFECSEINVSTSMRTSDSLELNESSFYAELKRLKMILEDVKIDHQSFFLIDEILKGTNSTDRHKGSVAMLHQLLQYNGTGLISTHDLELADKAENIAGVENYSFEVQIVDKQLDFDYTLRKGICRSFNASVLMQQMGIDVADV